MGVAPLLHIAHRDVHSADECHFVVDDAEFSVVSVVDSARQGREAHGHKGLNVDAATFHLFVERRRYAPTAHIVVNQAHFHASGGAVGQRVGHQSTQWVVVEEPLIRDALRFMAVEEQTLVEGASAMAVAAVREYPDIVGGNDVAIIISGGNVDGEVLSRVLNETAAQE